MDFVIRNQKYDETLNADELVRLSLKIEESYHQNEHWGLVTNIDAGHCNAQKIRSEAAIKDFTEKLCDLIQVSRFQDTVVVNFGEDERIAGYSMVQLIETSLVSGHFANSTNSAYLDVFSCKFYNPFLVLGFTQEFFNAKEMYFTIGFRKHFMNTE